MAKQEFAIVDKNGEFCCDQMFDTARAAKFHMSFWKEKERAGCKIVNLSEKANQRHLKNFIKRLEKCGY